MGKPKYSIRPVGEKSPIVPLGFELYLVSCASVSACMEVD
jgi:hypothetical protein